MAGFLDGLLKKMDLGSRIDTDFEDGVYQLIIEAGENDGILIGRKGETLDALQHVVQKMAGRGREGLVDVKVDVSGYRERREKQLVDQAIEIAEQVRSTGRSRQTEPLRAAERRIIHRALTDIPGVQTRAIGTGLVKKIMIEPEGLEPDDGHEDRQPDTRSAEGDNFTGEVLDYISDPLYAEPRDSAGPATREPTDAEPASTSQRNGAEEVAGNDGEGTATDESEWGRKPRPARRSRLNRR